MITQATFTKHPSNALRMTVTKAAFNASLLINNHKIKATVERNGNPYWDDNGKLVSASRVVTTQMNGKTVYLSELVELPVFSYTGNPLVSVSYPLN